MLKKSGREKEWGDFWDRDRTLAMEGAGVMRGKGWDRNSVTRWRKER